MERKRKWISLNVKVNVVIIAIVLVLACGLAGIAYYVNGQRTDRYYKDSTAKMAAAVAHFVDGDFVARLQAAVESEEYVQLRQQAEAAKDVNLSRLLTKLGPVLGLIGTLISMSPALVGLSTGDISGMAYNMQVVFSATVVGLVISVVGLFTQQLKSRWHQQDISRLEYVSSQYIEKHEKEA